MRIISRKRLRKFCAKHSQAEGSLSQWYKFTKEASWKNFAEVKATFGSVDTTKVKSGRSVYVFDIKGNDFRLIAAIHFDSGIVFILAVLTHEEYDDEKWKDGL